MVCVCVCGVFVCVCVGLYVCGVCTFDVSVCGFFMCVRGGTPQKTRLVSMPPNAEEWEKDNVSACSLDLRLSIARRTSSCNNSIGRTVSFREGSFCDPVEIVMCDLKEQRTCLKFCFLLGKTPTE